MERRSLLFIPAKEKTIGKVGFLGADAYIIDLEDSIEEYNKEKALNLVVDRLESILDMEYSIFIRLNKHNYHHEIELLSKYSQVGFMLPKFEFTNDYSDLSDVWKKHEIIALVESPLGIINLNSICQCDWVDAVAFGAEDYTASVNMNNEFKKLYFQKSMIITYCKAFGKKAYDTPSFQLKDMEAFVEEVEDARSIGFDGKLLIHPKHIESINELFSSANIEYMKEIVNAYDAQNEAVFVYKDKVYEKMHISRFKRVIKENGGF